MTPGMTLVVHMDSDGRIARVETGDGQLVGGVVKAAVSSEVRGRPLLHLEVTRFTVKMDER